MISFITYPITSYVNDAYTGASITINTTSGIDVTSDVRIIDDYYSTQYFISE